MLETRTIDNLVDAAAIDGTEKLAVTQDGSPRPTRKISGDVPRIDDLDVMTALNESNDQIRISQGSDDHKRMTIAAFLVAAGITSYAEAVDMSAADYDQSDTSSKQIYSVTTGAGSQAFNLLTIAELDGCRVRIEKIDTGAGVGAVTPDGAETFFGGATSFPLRVQGDFIEFESVNGVLMVIDSLSTLDSALLAAVGVPGAINTAHGVGARLRYCQDTLLCAVADLNYVADDEATIMYGCAARRTTISWDATNIIAASELSPPVINNKTTGVAAVPTANHWKYRFRIGL